MSQQLRDVMTTRPLVLPRTASVRDVTLRLPSTLARINAAPSDDPPTEARATVRTALRRDQAGPPGRSV